MSTSNAKQIPEILPSCLNLAQLLACPSRWFLLASRPASKEGEVFEWEYELEGKNFAEIQRRRQEILLAADAWKVFCPQRKIGGRDEWIAIALKKPIELPKRAKHRMEG